VGRVWSSRGAQQGVARCTHAGPWLESNLFVPLPAQYELPGWGDAVGGEVLGNERELPGRSPRLLEVKELGVGWLRRRRGLCMETRGPFRHLALQIPDGPGISL